MPSFALINSNHHFQVPLQIQPVTAGNEDGFQTKICVGTQNRTILQMKWPLASKNRVVLANLGCWPIQLRSRSLESGFVLEVNATVATELPFQFQVDDDCIEIAHQDEASGSGLVELTSVFGGNDESHKSPSPATLEAWFGSLSRLQRLVAGSHEFFLAAADALVKPGGLDGAMILLPVKQKWSIAASRIPNPELGFTFNEIVVEKVSRLRQTHFQPVAPTGTETKDPCGAHWCVACPVIDGSNNVIAVLYGFRGSHRHNSRRGIRMLEAQFAQLVADSVGSAMLRLQGEAEAARRRVLLEQAFSPAVARELEANPDILKGQYREVSVMFADLRQFSSISERIGAPETYRLLTEILDRFCDIIYRHDGVIIDFYGDGVSAFWNAPLEQPDHAVLACSAALEIANCIPELNETWQSFVGQSLQVGIGVNTGMAQVGNSGSTSRLKYGPQGRTVNVASRLENATKQIGIPILVSGTTAAQLKGKFQQRRICSTFLKGFSERTDIFQIADVQEPIGSKWETYGKALCEFENGHTTEAISLLMSLQLKDVNDAACEYLLEQALAVSQPGTRASKFAKSEIIAFTNPARADSTSVSKLEDGSTHQLN